MSDLTTDIVLECKDCGRNFTFTKGEQEFYAQKGLSTPTRCPDCRRARKQQKASGGYDNYSGGGGYGGSRSSSGGAGRGQDRDFKEVFEVICEECGRQTTVPFKPRGTHPVLCRDCFSRRKSV